MRSNFIRLSVFVSSLTFCYSLSSSVSADMTIRVSNGTNLPLSNNQDAIQTTMKPHCRTKRYALFGPKFHKKNITYDIEKYSKRFHRFKINRAVKEAFNAWEKYTPLTFYRNKKGNADIRISFFSSRNHFKGELAHATHPGFFGPMQIHVYDKANWDYKLKGKPGWAGMFPRADLVEVLVHEIGHTLGLAHSKSRKAIMYKYTSMKKFKGLSKDDIKGIQKLYHKKKN